MTQRPKIETEVLLSTLWIFVLFNYLYCDVIGLMDHRVLSQMLTGTVDGIELTPGFLFAGAILMEIPIAMVLLSRILAYRANRWANIVAAAIKTVAMIATLLTGAAAYYWFFAVIEIATTVFIIYLAWNWKPQAAMAA